MNKIALIDIINQDFWRFPSEFIESAKSIFHQYEIIIINDLIKQKEQLKDVSGIITFPIPANLIRNNHKLEWVHFLSSQVPLSWQKFEDKYKITNSHANSNGVAEHALHLSLKALREKHDISKLAQNSNIGIIGNGKIGQALTKLTVPLFKDVRILTQKKDQQSLNQFNYDELKAFFQNLDIIVVATSLTNTSQTFFQSNVFFDYLNNNISLINIARGELFLESDLVQFFTQNKNAQYLTDVTYPEPYPQDGPLNKLNNIYITPHIAGQFEGLWNALTKELEDVFKGRI